MSEPKPMPLTAEENRDEVRDAVARVNRAIKESDAHICVDGLIRPYMQLVCSSRCHHEKPTEFRQLQEEKAGLSLALDAERAARAAGRAEGCPKPRKWPEGRPAGVDYRTYSTLRWLPVSKVWQNCDAEAMRPGDFWLPQPAAPDAKEARP